VFIKNKKKIQCRRPLNSKKLNHSPNMPRLLRESESTRRHLSLLERSASFKYKHLCCQLGHESQSFSNW